MFKEISLQEKLSQDEEQILEQVYQYLKTLSVPNMKRFTPHYILRFCRARKFDLGRTKNMIQNHVDWLVKNNVDNMGSMDMSKYGVLKANTCVGYCNTDKYGRPVYIERLKFLDVDKIFSQYSDQELIEYYAQSYERQTGFIYPECSRVAGSRIDKTVTIMDLENVSIMSLLTGKVKAFLKLTIGITQDNYPETLGQMFVINSGFMFSAAWTIIKAFLDPVTQQKIKIISGEGKKELLALIPSENLPVFLGGTFQGEIPQNHGPWKQSFDESFIEKSLQHKDQSLLDFCYGKPMEN